MRVENNIINKKEGKKRTLQIRCFCEYYELTIIPYTLCTSMTKLNLICLTKAQYSLRPIRCPSRVVSIGD